MFSRSPPHNKVPGSRRYSLWYSSTNTGQAGDGGIAHRLIRGLRQFAQVGSNHRKDHGRINLGIQEVAGSRK